MAFCLWPCWHPHVGSVVTLLTAVQRERAERGQQVRQAVCAKCLGVMLLPAMGWEGTKQPLLREEPMKSIHGFPFWKGGEFIAYGEPWVLCFHLWKQSRARGAKRGCWKVKLQGMQCVLSCFSRIWLTGPMGHSLPGFSISGLQEFWSGLACCPQEMLPTQGSEPSSHISRIGRRVLLCAIWEAGNSTR